MLVLHSISPKIPWKMETSAQKGLIGEFFYVN